MRKWQKNKLHFYKSRTFLNWLVVMLAIVIGTTSVLYTRNLVDKLKEREKRLIELYAKTLEYTANDATASNLFFVVQEIMIPNNSIPIVLTDGASRPIDSRNIDMAPNLTEEEQEEFLREEVAKMKKEHEPIQISIRDDDGEIYDYQFIYYSNSDLLVSLEYYPHVQLSVIAAFGFIVFMAFNSRKVAEQNRVWVGLAKETAHQLGTPISSLMAWVEYFKADEGFKDNEIIGELEKDIERLEVITQRFSNIGSVPVMHAENIPDTVEEVVNYLRKRISRKVEITLNSNKHDMDVNINKPLFSWVIENLLKNAVDAMSGVGKIHVEILKSPDNKAIIDISDTGKGIQKSKLKEVFAPGYTTKTRGWGLGLALAKRIIENYHRGRIFVKHSEVNEGTTFRIILSCYEGPSDKISRREKAKKI